MWCRWNYGGRGRRWGSGMCSLKIASLFGVKVIFLSSLGLLTCPWLKMTFSPNAVAQSTGDWDDSQRASGSDECVLCVVTCVWLWVLTMQFPLLGLINYTSFILIFYRPLLATKWTSSKADQNKIFSPPKKEIKQLNKSNLFVLFDNYQYTVISQTRVNI